MNYLIPLLKHLKKMENVQRKKKIKNFKAEKIETKLVVKVETFL